MLRCPTHQTTLPAHLSSDMAEVQNPAQWSARLSRTSTCTTSLLVAAWICSCVSLVLTMLLQLNGVDGSALRMFLSAGPILIFFQLTFVSLLSLHALRFYLFAAYGQLPPQGGCETQCKCGLSPECSYGAACGAPHSIAVFGVGWTAVSIMSITVLSGVEWSRNYGDAYFFLSRLVASYVFLIIAVVLFQVAASQVNELPGLGAHSCCSGAPPFVDAPDPDVCCCTTGYMPSTGQQESRRSLTNTGKAKEWSDLSPLLNSHGM